MEEYADANDISELEGAGYLGKIVYDNYEQYPHILAGFVHSDGEAIETLLTNIGINFKNDEVIVAKSEGY